MARKIIAIATRSGSEAEDHCSWLPTLYALCDDGTVWKQFPDEDTWHPIAPIPQPEPAEETSHA